MATAAAGIAIAVAVAAVVCLYYEYDPAAYPAPRCVFKVLTGYDCPGCGSQRALHALLGGRFAEAFGYNPYVFFAFPAAVYFVIVEALRKRYPRLHSRSTHPLVIAAVLAATLGWWIGRNL